MSPGIHFKVMFTWILKISITKFHLKFTHFKPQPHLPEDNELMSGSISPDNASYNGSFCLLPAREELTSANMEKTGTVNSPK